MEVVSSSFEYLVNLYLIYSGTEKPQALADIEDIGDAFYEDPEDILVSRLKKIIEYNKQQDRNMSTSQGRTEVYYVSICSEEKNS